MAQIGVLILWLPKPACVGRGRFMQRTLGLPNVAHMQTRPARADRREVDLRRLVVGFLRMAQDVAIVGEVVTADLLRCKPALRGQPWVTAPDSSGRRSVPLNSGMEQEPQSIVLEVP